MQVKHITRSSLLRSRVPLLQLRAIHSPPKGEEWAWQEVLLEEVKEVAWLEEVRGLLHRSLAASQLPQALEPSASLHHQCRQLRYLRQAASLPTNPPRATKPAKKNGKNPAMNSHYFQQAQDKCQRHRSRWLSLERLTTARSCWPRAHQRTQTAVSEQQLQLDKETTAELSQHNLTPFASPSTRRKTQVVVNSV